MDGGGAGVGLTPLGPVLPACLCGLEVCPTAQNLEHRPGRQRGGGREWWTNPGGAPGRSAGSAAACLPWLQQLYPQSAPAPSSSSAPAAARRAHWRASACRGKQACLRARRSAAAALHRPQLSLQRPHPTPHWPASAASGPLTHPKPPPLSSQPFAGGGVGSARHGDQAGGPSVLHASCQRRLRVWLQASVGSSPSLQGAAGPACPLRAATGDSRRRGARGARRAAFLLASAVGAGGAATRQAACLAHCPPACLPVCLPGLRPAGLLSPCLLSPMPAAAGRGWPAWRAAAPGAQWTWTTCG